MVSHERTYLTKLNEEAASTPESTLSHVETLVKQYPYFQALRHLEWKLAQELNLENKNTLLSTCSLQTKHRLHLINNPTESEPLVAVATEQEVDNEVRTFSDWLQHIQNPDSSTSETDRLINKFIADAPKIKFSKISDKPKNLTKKQSFDEQMLMTETLAEVYFKQGKLKKAKNAYEILALKYPEKSGFFADQLKKINNTLNES
ncbi:MAG: hypothetical protein P8H25_01310 [Flavobacteriaceae bacterium]|nr:hypothetical protein [Flavobacteriaceae bacterium]